MHSVAVSPADDTMTVPPAILAPDDGEQNENRRMADLEADEGADRP